MTTQQKFKTGPKPDQLKEMDRDLHFHPSQSEAPKVLTRAQIESYNGGGYIKGIPIFDQDEVVEFEMGGAHGRLPDLPLLALPIPQQAIDPGR